VTTFYENIKFEDQEEKLTVDRQQLILGILAHLRQFRHFL